MRVRDARGRVLRDERDDFFVTEENGKYFGICRTPDVLNPPRLRIILVDHNEAGQAIGALDEASHSVHGRPGGQHLYPGD
jgi:manganese-dependent inorganic pyrophosphatase